MTMIATVIRQFWFPIVAVIAMGIYFIRAVEGLLVEEAAAGWLDVPVDLHDLAYVIVRLIESYIYLDLITGEDPETRTAEPILRLLLR